MCYECKGDDRIAAQCPIRLERVKNSGLERLPKGKGKGKGTLAWKQ